MKNINIQGVLYFFIHFITEVITFYIIGHYTSNELFYIIALIFDFLAFVPQGIIGYLIDEFDLKNITLIGTLLMILSLILLYLNINPIINVLFLAIGNAMTHIDGAEKTLRSSKGKMSSAALFVSGGSFGLITGKILQLINTPIIIIIIIAALTIIPIIISNKYNNYVDSNNLKEYNFSNKIINTKIIIILATFIVIIRAYMGYAIPTTWNKTIIQSILLFSFMGTGKALGGILIDKIGIRKTSFISTIVALPFLLFGDNNIYISLIGIMLFSITMAITLGIIVSELNNHPGVAFGFTTLGLFLGTLPVFFIKIKNIYVNCTIIILLTILSIIILNKICRKDDKNVKSI